MSDDTARTTAPCHYCGLSATHTNWIMDATKRGINANEPGYRQVYLCSSHALEARRNNEHRVERIAADDEGSDPFADWISYSPPSDAYLRPEPPAARLMCADGRARLMALAEVGRGGRL